jgi:hypothetical protein
MVLINEITITSIKNLILVDERLNDTEIYGFHIRIPQQI